ncbi:12950_t:CDS:2 [Rhizophagus irregularis]|nr:12950_t:CDS:2 [Rhizophagus irregularis]
MSCDIVQHPFADKLLKKVNILTTFFRNNARAGAKFWELLNTMNIKGGVIMLYCKTRWTTAYKSIDDVLRVKAVLENSSIELEPPYLQQLAIHLFSVYPNSASYEYEFSICGWLLNKRSNASYKLAFYEKDVKKILQKFSNNELNNIINETLAEQPKLAEENDNEIALEKN